MGKRQIGTVLYVGSADTARDPPGSCLPDPACGKDAIDAAASQALSTFPKQTWEEGAMFVCSQKEISAHKWASTRNTNNVCRVRIKIPDQSSCWVSGDYLKGRECNVSIVHIHPFFIVGRDSELVCNGDEVTADENRVANLDDAGMVFSNLDISQSIMNRVEGQPPWRLRSLRRERTQVLGWC